MKNKILVLFLLCLTIIPIFNGFVLAAETEVLNASECFTPNETIINEIPQKPLTLEEWQLSSELLNKAKNNGYISTFELAKPSQQSIRTSCYTIYILDNIDGKFYYSKEVQGTYFNHGFIKCNSNVIRLQYYWNSNWNLEYTCFNISSSDFNKNGGNEINVTSDESFLSSVAIYNNENFSEIYKEPNVNQDDTIGDPTSDLQLSYEYNEDNTSCHINATLKNGAFTDQIYYSNYQPGITGELLSKKAFPKDGIDVTENQSLFFQAEDKDGKILAKNSISIFGIGKLDPDNFIVDIDASDGKIKFSSKILNNGWVYNKILCKIYDNENNNLDNLRVHTMSQGAVTPFLEDVTDSFKDSSCEIGQNKEYTIINNSFSKKNITLYFEVRNRETDKVMLTQKYDCNITTITAPTTEDNSVNSGIINEGQEDEKILDETNDKNIANNLNQNSSLNLDWSLSSAKDTIKEFFTTAKEFFNLILDFVNQLPKWITVPLYTLFMLAIVVFVFHVIRG